jgi:ABC-type multidrug transport system fused ATPase/permease subunit
VSPCLFADSSSSVEANSLERIQSYIDIEHEAEAKDGGVPPAYWPASGDIRVENLTARYSPDGPVVLDNLSFHIKAGERVGVVGRTGSGKSTLTLSLLRCIFTDGEMYYDGIPTSSINLDALRSNVTIIPQAVRRSTSPSVAALTSIIYTAGAPHWHFAEEPGHVRQARRRRAE